MNPIRFAGVLGIAGLLLAGPARGQVDVPSNWPLTPSGMQIGDEYRLMLVGRQPLAATSTDIAYYDAHLHETIAELGHYAVTGYASHFKVLGSTATVDARTHTGTTGSGGVPIYWLGGPRVADDYGDFWDGSWTNKGQARRAAGNRITGTNRNQDICTGTNDDGTRTANPLGGDGSGGGVCTATRIDDTGSTLGGRTRDVTDPPRFFALSDVFRVGATSLPFIDDVSITSDPGEDDEYVVGDEIEVTVTFSNAVTVTGTPQLSIRLTPALPRRADYSAAGSTSTALVFTYEVTADDYSRYGVELPGSGLDRSGGTIRAGAVDAQLGYDAVGPHARHRVHYRPYQITADVTSTPANGYDYRTGEVLQITAGFNKAVKVVGTPTFELYLVNGKVVAPYARVMDNDKVQFEYTIKADDYEETSFESHIPSIQMPAGNVIVHSLLSDSAAVSGFEVKAKTNKSMRPPGRVNINRPFIVPGGITVTSTPTARHDIYGQGEAIEFTVRFSDAMTVDTTGGTPWVLVHMGTDLHEDREAKLLYVSGTGTTDLVFRYTVQPTDVDDDGLAVYSGAVSAGGGTIRDAAEIDAYMARTQPGDRGIFFPAHKVRGSLVPGAPNLAPEFAGTTATRSFTETVGDATAQLAADLGAAFTATDDDGDTLTYTLEGADAGKFAIAPATGQLRTRVGERYDREARSSYSVTVKADDDYGGTATIAVAIDLVDASEPPLRPAAPAVSPIAGSTDRLGVVWTPPGNAGRPAIDSYDLRYRQAGAGAWVDGPRHLAAFSATLTDLDAATAYEVKVRASNADGDGAWSNPGTGSTGEDTGDDDEGDGGSEDEDNGDDDENEDGGDDEGDEGEGGNGGEEDDAGGAGGAGGGGGGGGGAPAPGENEDEGGDDDGNDDDGEGGPADSDGPPRADFAVSVDCTGDLCRGRTGVPVRFTDTSTGRVTSRLWRFGDGGTSRNGTVEHAWSSPGFYEATLRVSDGVAESTASATFLIEAARPAGTCEASEGRRCLRDSRYAVSVEWNDANGEGGSGTVVHAGTNDSGLFSFFDRDNWEILIKVLDGCALNGHVWVFGASTTDLGYEIRVTDTATATLREYRNEPGLPAQAMTDVTAFPDGCDLSRGVSDP